MTGATVFCRQSSVMSHHAVLPELLRAVFGRRDAGPAPERPGESSLPGEAEQERHLDHRFLRVFEVAQRELVPRVVNELLVTQLGFGELPLERAPAHVQRFGHALLGNLARRYLLQQGCLAARRDVAPVERRKLPYEYAVECARELAVRGGKHLAGDARRKQNAVLAVIKVDRAAIEVLPGFGIGGPLAA